MNRFQVMGIVTAIQRHERQVFGDSCLTLNLSDIVRKAEQEMAYYHDSPVDALKQAESALTDASNMLDQANDRYKTTNLGKRVVGLFASGEWRWAYVPAANAPELQARIKVAA